MLFLSRHSCGGRNPVFQHFLIAVFLDSRFRGNDRNGELFWTAFVKKDNLILESEQVCLKNYKF